MRDKKIPKNVEVSSSTRRVERANAYLNQTWENMSTTRQKGVLECTLVVIPTQVWRWSLSSE